MNLYCLESPLSLITARLSSPSSPSLSSKEWCFSPLIIFEALCWTLCSTAEPSAEHSTPDVDSPLLNRREGSPASTCWQYFLYCCLNWYHWFGCCLWILPMLVTLASLSLFFLFIFEFGQELSADPQQASWSFCLTSYLLQWTALQLGGGDPGKENNFLALLFPPVLYLVGTF